jgi:nitrilase
MPTNPERMVWGMGDATGLRVVDTPVGRVGCLICWESYMPLARYALYAQRIDILVNPTWDNGELCLATLRHIAREGGCWVIGTATACSGSDIPADSSQRDRLFQPEEWINDGDAVVVKPRRRDRGRPVHRQKRHPLRRDRHGGGRPAPALAGRQRPLFAAGHLLALGEPEAASKPVDFQD